MGKQGMATRHIGRYSTYFGRSSLYRDATAGNGVVNFDFRGSSRSIGFTPVVSGNCDEHFVDEEFDRGARVQGFDCRGLRSDYQFVEITGLLVSLNR